MASSQPTMPSPSMVVFTDLDGTLLDHSTYSHGPADAALKRLRARGIPCVPTTSKTRTEVLAFREQLHNRDPFIVENGSAVYIQRSTPFDCSGLERLPDSGLYVHRFSRPRTEILQLLRDSGARDEFRWRGFADMTVGEIARHTGLSDEGAQAASWREYCEPVLWLDDPLKLPAFASLLQTLNLSCVRGGRFIHILDGVADKGAAMRWLCSRLHGHHAPTTVALGDSDNDAEMLNAADIAVLVRSAHHDCPQAAGRRRTLHTQGYGPFGWSEAINALLDEDEN